MKQVLREDYEKLWATMVVKNNDKLEIIINRMLAKKSQYQAVELSTGVPWYVVASIHFMEGGSDFKRQLHNGQRWDRKTTLVPKGKGPWRTWHEAAVDAIRKLNEDMLSELGESFQWDIPSICYAFEDHNGWGYRKYHKQVKSPYLWSYSNHYTRGKYFADGKFSDSSISKQIGAMIIVMKLKKSMEEVKPEPPRVEPVESKPVPSEPIKKKKWWKFWCWFK